MKILPNLLKTFEYYKQLGVKAIDQCSDEGLFKKYNEDSNSISIIVKHLHGNMMSRWTDFLNTDGEKDFRDRDGEFEETFNNRAELTEKYNEGWACLLNAIQSLNEDNLEQTVYIRNQGHTALEAINRQLAHVPYHIGQIVYLSRMYPKSSWESLSIPKGTSKAFNDSHFGKPKQKRHYTDDFLDK